MNPCHKKCSITEIYRLTFNSLKNKNKLFLPFLIFAGIDLIGLILLYLAPQEPFLKVLGPPIRAFWGEAFLHYPMNFILLPKLESLNRMCLSIILGSLLTGVAVAMVYDDDNYQRISLRKSFRSALKKYVSLFTVVLTVSIIFYFTTKVIPSTVNFLIAILVQSVFIYAIPILMLENVTLVKAIAKSFGLFRRFFVVTIILVGLPMFIYAPIIVLQSNTSFLINRLFPEFILIVCMASVIINSLAIDALVTVSTTLLYLKQKEKA